MTAARNRHDTSDSSSHLLTSDCATGTCKNFGNARCPAGRTSLSVGWKLVRGQNLLPTSLILSAASCPSGYAMRMWSSRPSSNIFSTSTADRSKRPTAAV